VVSPEDQFNRAEDHEECHHPHVVQIISILANLEDLDFAILNLKYQNAVGILLLKVCESLWLILLERGVLISDCLFLEAHLL